MTIRSDRQSEAHGQSVSLAIYRAEAVRSRRLKVVISSGILAASPVVALMMLMSQQTASAAPEGRSAGVSARPVSMPLSTPPPSPSGEAGMEHGSMDMDMPTTNPDEHGSMDMDMDMPTTNPDEHGSGEATTSPHEHGSTEPTTSPDEHGSGDMPGMKPGEKMGGGHGDTEKAAVVRPLVPVLGTFGGGAAAVMLTAGVMRRKDQAKNAAKDAARAARRSQK